MLLDTELRYWEKPRISKQLLATLVMFWLPAAEAKRDFNIDCAIERFWEDPKLGGGIGFRSEFPSNLTVDATVCKNVSSGCYRTVQEAVNAAPNATEQRFVIHIKEGVYEEIVRIPFEKKNVVFLGDGMGKTIITGSLSVAQPGVTTYESATVGKFKPFPCFLSSSLDWYLWCQTGPKFAKLCTLFYKSTRLLSYFKASSTRFCW